MASLVEKINGVGVYISRGIHVIDNLLSTSSVSPLSAKQGKVLDGKIADTNADIGDISELPIPTDTVIGNIEQISSNLTADVGGLSVPFNFVNNNGKYGFINEEDEFMAFGSSHDYWDLTLSFSITKRDTANQVQSVETIPIDGTMFKKIEHISTGGANVSFMFVDGVLFPVNTSKNLDEGTTYQLTQQDTNNSWGYNPPYSYTDTVRLWFR